MKKIRNIAFLVVGLFASSVYASGLCEDKLFTLSAGQEDGVTVGDILGQFASECNYSMLVVDRAAKERLSKSITSLNINELPLEKVFDLLLTENELNYKFDGNLLKISFLTTETFQISYIGTARIGTSNTDVILSQNSMMSDQQTQTGQGNTGQGLQTGGQTNTSNLQSEVHRSLISSGLQSNNIDSVSGTKIASVDEFDFWGRLEKEIFEIAFRPGDAHQPKRKFSTDANQQAQSANQDDKADGGIGDGQSVVVNKIAGLVTVTGTIKQLDRVRKYIKNLEEQMQNQVMIDVNILTVTHSNSNTVGVDWNQLYNVTNLTLPNGMQEITGTPLFNIGGGGGGAVFSTGVSFNRVLEFLKTYGKVRSVSNPKVLTLNNQPALISVGSLLRYTQSSYTTNMMTGGSQTQNANTTYPSVFSGVLLDVTPSVQGDYIMLKINPSVTRTKDLNIENQATALQEPPNLSANQLSSLVRAKDGDKVILGGLITKNMSNTTSRVPILGYIPILKYLFSYSGTKEEVVEMVIVITPHIVKRASDNPSLQDLGYSETVNEVVKTDDLKTGLDEGK